MSNDETATERRPARAMLATIALATDLPLPTEVTFRDGVRLGIALATIADGVAWATRLGIQAAPYLNNDGNRYLSASSGQWHGWTVSLWACEKPGESNDLDADTTAALTAIAETAVEGRETTDVEAEKHRADGIAAFDAVFPPVPLNDFEDEAEPKAVQP